MTSSRSPRIPDDVELTCGGTLARLKAAGYRFGIVDLTRGEMGTRGSAEIRGKEAARAAEILGAEFREALDLGDGGLRRGREEELAVIDVIRREKPRIILTPVSRTTGTRTTAAPASS